MRRRHTVIRCLAILIASQPVWAEDPAASFLVRVFSDACIPHVGQPEKVRALAQKKHLKEITDPFPLKVFVGPGAKGHAWAVPSPFGSFALSIRGATQACAVYARAADPEDVESYFRKILEGAARPGMNIRIVNDTNNPGPGGIRHLLVYSVSLSDNPARGFLYMMQTFNTSNGPFQASLEAARYYNP
jgi:hypothetical protein